MSNQPSPTKGLYEQYENYKGIDLSSQRSPFKQMNKQLQAQADGMPLETESNVNDDAQEQQESHIDLINETTRMKHLAMNQELKNQQLFNNVYLMEADEGLSPKVNLNYILGQNNRMLIGQLETQQLQFTPAHLNRNQLQQQQLYYDKGLPKSQNKHHNNSVSSNNSNSSSKRGSIAPSQQIEAFKMHPLTSAQPSGRLEPCQKCIRKQIYEERQLVSGGGKLIGGKLQQSPTPQPNQGLNDTQNIEEEHDFYYEKIRFLIVDCRLDSIQKEAFLPNSFKLSIPSECTKEYLQSQTEKLTSCKEIYHICLLGLDPLSEKTASKFETNKNEGSQAGADSQLEIGAYHESILRFLIEDFQKKGFKYISVVPGGFQEIHEIAIRYNFPLVDHQNVCYHCEQSKQSLKQKSEVYNQQFNLIGFGGDLFSGIKHLYDVAGTKIKNLVKGGANASGNPAQRAAPIIQHNKSDMNVNRHGLSQMPQLDQTRQNQNQGMPNAPQTYRQQQKQMQNNTFDNVLNSNGMPGHHGLQSLGIPAKLAQQTLQETSSVNSSEESLYQSVNSQQRHQVIAQSEGRHNNRSYQVPLQVGEQQVYDQPPTQRRVLEHANYLSGQALTSALVYHQGAYPLTAVPSQHQENLPVGSLPMSFISQSSRQENQHRFHGSHCSSNASVNSSQNDGGNNLRDAISNKKIMSYKLMSKVPGDRNQEQAQGMPDRREPQDDEPNALIMRPSAPSLQIVSNAESTQGIASPLSTTHLVIQSQFSMAQSDIDKQLSDIKILLSPQSDKNLGTKAADDRKYPILAKQGGPDQQIQMLDGRQQVKSPVKSSQMPQQQEGAGKVPEANPQFTEEDLYYINGLCKQVEIYAGDMDILIKKKQNIIIYKAMKLHLKKKPADAQSSSASAASTSSTPSIAYPVFLIISQYTVSVVREMGKRRSHLLGPVNQSIESSMTQLEEWDQADFDELHPQLAGGTTKGDGSDKNTTPTKGVAGTNPNPVALIESRFMMYDLIKITSRKSSAKIITFYFRVPLIEEYASSVLEKNILQQLDQRPPIKYQFAFKRKNYKEVSVSFEFSQQDEAKECIEKVSSIYKKLKNTKQA